MAKINEYFLKAIFKEPNIEQKRSIVELVSEMSKYVLPILLSDENNYTLYYSVKFEDLLKFDIDETEAFKLRQLGWTLDENETHVINVIG